MDNKTSDFELLAIAANYFKTELQEENLAWKGSPFEWVLQLPPGSKGKLGKQLIPYGGTLDQAFQVLKGLSPRR